MLGKHRIGPQRDEVPAAKRLRVGLERAFVGNLLSGSQAQKLLVDAGLPGSSKECALATRRVSSEKNVARDLSARLMRHSSWPKPYIAKIRTHDPKRSRENPETAVSILLPHEIAAKLVLLGSKEQLLQRSGMDPPTRRKLESCEATMGCELLGLGLWGDGVPVNWDR